MKRKYFHPLLVISLGLILQVGLLSADDRIDYRDSKNKTGSLIANGTIVDENFTTIRIKLTAGGKEVTIPANDLTKISYELPGTAKLDYGPIAIAEERQDFTKALEGYKGLQNRVTGSERAKRFVDYKISVLTAILSNDNSSLLQPAIDLLKKFVSTNNSTWHTINAYKLLIALQLRANDATGALASVDSFSRLDKLPKELKQEAEFARVDVLFSTKKIREAKSKAEELAKSLASSDPLKAKLNLYVLASAADDPTSKMADLAKQFEEQIAQSSDNSFKAVAYNVLGDCYNLKNQPREAMWSYLWVDVVYNQDRTEHLKALDRLVKLFDSESMKDADRAKLYKDKLTHLRQ
ncbi:hypothetical protein KIH39_03525 [Telmatocola sphagniphila]|uniref:Tetratricopeptide repeat protein n=1 Tax=Telmatocola sphagniphila TaxID=1123043 RepID=A0A8E6B6X2_9BACT|nr:hypothetical protein [Telmatocola sphagniphila]QVL32998.1 hypothetical protein KIH39_03525 [Telmatocola sphagniphila]